jgi:serine/threonine protein phosphatase 1
MNAYNIWNLDTGAGFKGRLTIMEVETKAYWQSDLLTELYDF